jgi:probable rRNA maturation factor
MTREIAIANRHPRLRFERRTVLRAIAVLEENAATIRVPQTDFLAGELSIVFLADAALAQLHAEFLDDPATTDVITFEGAAAHGSAGEICVSADTAERFARKNGHDFSEELTLYLVHGWLHLAGYDDLAPAKKRVMRRAESRAMSVLRRHNALPRFKLAPPRGRRARNQART